ncbi:MAG TPA: carbohydrate-binding family V/XII [Nitrospiria bacterium]|nr:carbohydrate-binding family V/XII [Nitrospiria bacterium]
MTTGSQTGQELTWPRVHHEPGLTIFIYQPQIEQWKGDRIEARMAVGMQQTGAKSPVYGVVWMSARADVDKAARIVMIRDTALTKASFPTEPTKEGGYLSVLRKYFSKGPKAVALDHLEADFAISQAVKQAQVVAVKNTPPRIIFSSTPALLVLIDGPPVLRPVKGQQAERIINTNALIVKIGGRFYLSAMNDWYQASQVEGPWSMTTSVPASLEPIKRSLAENGQVDLLEPPPDAALPPSPPAVYVSTVPAEVIQTDGQPQLVPIEGTGLLQVKNSDNIIFMDVNSNSYYVLISGRWFQSKSLNGPWSFVSGKNLPADFAKIPPDHPRANALVSVPGTPQADEAVIANSIPQTSTVDRRGASLEVTYDGPPRFEPIEDTPLQYAVNSPVPVIRVDPQSYYSVQNGVWFVAPSPTGPWSVATDVPAVIYSIPPSSPLYYVTYVRVYGSTGDDVYVGYTPGYLGTVVSPDDTVVYGTGYDYPPYIGTDWIGWPCTYGWNAGFEWDLYGGFAFGFAAAAIWGAWWNPWWGPIGWGWHHRHRPYTHVNLNRVNIYHNWDRRAVTVTHPYRSNEYRNGRWTQAGGTTFNPYSARQRTGDRSWDANARRVAPRPATRAPSTTTNNIYGGRNGHVYRYNPSGYWERNTPSGWQNAERAGGFQSQSRELNQERNGRIMGQQMFNNSRSSGSFRSSGSPGGGVRGGGGNPGGAVHGGGGTRGGIRR